MSVSENPDRLNIGLSEKPKADSKDFKVSENGKLKVANDSYVLKSAIIYLGGHYVEYVLNDNRTWTILDDARVTPGVKFEEGLNIINQKAMMVSYDKIS